MSEGWWRVLDAVDLHWVPVTARRIQVELASGVVELDVARVAGRLRPSVAAHLVASAATGRTVIVADSAGAAALDVVRAAGQSLVTQDGGVLLQVDSTVVVEQTPPAPVPAPRGRRGRPPWGRLAVIRRLLEAGPLSQADLALLSGVGQRPSPRP